MRWRNLNERAMQNVIKREMRTPRAKRKVGPEAKLLSDAVAMLRNIPKLFVMRVQVGGTRHTSANGKVRFAKSTMTGCADLLVWYRGVPIAIEMKAPKGKLSEGQKIWRDNYLLGGGLYCVAKSLDCVIRVLRVAQEMANDEKK